MTNRMSKYLFFAALAFLIIARGTEANADACRLHTPVLAAGNGHNAACLIAEDGRVSIVEYGLYDSDDFNKDGSNALIRYVRGAPLKIKLNSEGHAPLEEMAKIVSAFAEYYGLDAINVSYFPQIIDYDGAMREITTIESEIRSGKKYKLFTQNCTHIATRILTAAGVKKLENGPNPNAVIRLEMKGSNKKYQDPYNWTGKWVRDLNDKWKFEPVK